MTITIAVDRLLHETEAVARGAGGIAAGALGQAKNRRTKDDHSPVTDTDLAVEQYIISCLSKSFPGHGFLCEESGNQNPGAEYTWIVDPIDGTSYFARGVPLYSVSIALRHREDLLLGVVFEPETDELFSAVADRGARRNGEVLHCSEVGDLSDATLCVEIPNRHLPGELTEYALEKLGVLMPTVDRLRVFGVSALGLCYCAGGGFDAYVNMSGASKIWDLAAGQVILREAGGVYTQCKNHVIVAGPRPLHDQLIELLELPV